MEFLKNLEGLALFLAMMAFLQSTIYYTYFWQLKEYRWDRMRDFLTTKSGRRKIFNWFFGLRFLLLISLVIFLVMGRPNANLTPIFYAALLIFAGLEMLEAIWRATKRKFYRPDKTGKALLIIITTLVLASVPWAIYALFSKSTGYIEVYIYLGIIDAYLFTPLINALAVVVFYPVTLISKAVILRRAERKIAQMQSLKVIAITGSYGKSSVKEILAEILSGKYRVLKTPGNTNTEIGVAGIILKHLRPTDQVFIVEAGAYKIGEIRKIAKLVSARIGIITAVKDAHLAMFGSLENIKKAKFELIENLPEFGTAIFNLDNDGAADLAYRAEDLKLGKIVKYGTDRKADLAATDVEETLEGIKFKIAGVEFAAPLPGRHNVSNILAAVAAALEMDMKLPEIAERVKKIKLRKHTLTVIKPRQNLVLIDDTYNANPDGVIAGLNYLNLYKDWQKIVVFPGMLELGSESSAEHRRVAEKMGTVANEAFLTSGDFEKPLLEGFQKAHFSDYLFLIDRPADLLDELQRRISKRPTVILFISRGSELALKKLQNET